VPSLCCDSRDADEMDSISIAHVCYIATIPIQLPSLNISQTDFKLLSIAVLKSKASSKLQQHYNALNIVAQRLEVNELMNNYVFALM